MNEIIFIFHELTWDRYRGAADGRVTRWYLPRTQGYPAERLVNTGWSRKGKAFAVREGPAAYQLVGKVTAYQGYDG